jgi:hypothetical protein
MSEGESARGLEGVCCWRERLWRDLDKGDAPPSFEVPPPAREAFDIAGRSWGGSGGRGYEPEALSFRAVDTDD